MDGTELPPIPPLALHGGIRKDDINPQSIVEKWLGELEALFTDKSHNKVSELLIDDCWWRDMVGLDWDFTSKHGHKAISEYLSRSLHGISDLQTIDSTGLKPFVVEIGPMTWIQAGFNFKTPHGQGRGFVRLTNVEKDSWKAWTVFTQLERLNYQDELDTTMLQRASAHTAQVIATNNKETSNSNSTEEQSDLQVLIVGAGQAGLALGARLKHMGISNLLIDRNARVGDSWRARYRSITMNTPTYTDHYPFLKLPENWPRWLPREKVADFMEHYGKLIELDLLLNAEVEKVQYVESERRYRVEVRSLDKIRIFRPRHVVLATGVYGEEPIVPKFPGEESFTGSLYHSSKHTSASDVPDIKNKRVAIIGCGTSAHDVAQDFVTYGAKEVSMIQRHPIYSMSSDAVEKFQLCLWNTNGISTEEADLLGNSFPLAVIRTMSIELTNIMRAHDKDMLDGLEKAGLALKRGNDAYGLADYQLIKGGHFYVDQGANEMIIDGRIKIHRCEEGVSEIHSNGIKLCNGTDIDADIIVLATGYEYNIRTVEKLMGKDIAEKANKGGAFGLLDKENERGGWWRPTGVPGFWYMTGSFMWCRQFSLPLALQIAAVEKGLNNEHYGK